MATKLQNLERVEATGKAKDGTVVIDRESGSKGTWTVNLQWTADGMEVRCWGRGTTLEAALADWAAKADKPYL